MIWGQNIGILFAKIGLTRWPLLICSAIGLAIIVERVVYYTKLRLDYASFSRKLFIHLRQNQLTEAVSLCQKSQNPVAHIAGIYLKNLKNKKRDGLLTREGSFAIEKVESKLRGLATITHVAPLLGLLGTVAGLVLAFHEIELTVGQVQVKNLAGGIWEALLSTVFGLIVAIPCMIAYHTFESVADRIARRMLTIISELDEFYGNDSPKDFRVLINESDSENTVQ